MLRAYRPVTHHCAPIVFFVLTAAAMPCASAEPHPQGMEQARAELQRIAGEIEDPEKRIYGAIIHVWAPGIGLDIGAAAGIVDRNDQEPLTPQHTLRIASNTKTFVAAAVLRLVEDGRVDLNSSIARYLSPRHLEILTCDGYEIRTITTRHLLTHTSGLFDCAEGAMGNADADLDREWSRTEQLLEVITWGEPYGAPGEVFGYSDTNYILLGEIIERVTNLPLGAATRELVGFDRLGLSSTWWERREEPPAGAGAHTHQYFGYRDGYNVNPTRDLYGGGGLVSSMRDLAHFAQSLFAGDVLLHAATVGLMLAAEPAQRGAQRGNGEIQVPGRYEMGMHAIDVEGRKDFGHGGAWGTFVGYDRDSDVSIAIAVAQADIFGELESIYRRVSKTIAQFDLVSHSHLHASGAAQ